MHFTKKNIHAVRVFSTLLLLLFSSSLALAQQPAAASEPPAAIGDGWNSYGGDPGGTRYSTASQISRENVAQLKVAWTFHTGALQQQTNLIRKAAFEATPILVDDK